MDPLPRVLHVDTSTEWRGGQVQLVALACGMAERGWPVAVGCPRASPLWEALDGLDRLDLPAGRSPLSTLRLARASADLLAAHTSHAHTLCLPLSRPLVVHRRVDFLPGGGLKYRRPEAYVCVSQAVASIVERAGGQGCVVVPDGVDSLLAQAAAPDGPTVLAVGARVAHKGHRFLAEAAALLPGVDIGVAGDGPLLYPGLRWLGPRADVAALHAAAAVFVHPSIEEGMGQAVIEAMLSGLPVVCTDAGGLPEVVGGTAIVVPKGDPAALAEGIGRALRGEHPSIEAARERALERFSVRAMIDGSLAVYTRVAAASRRV